MKIKLLFTASLLMITNLLAKFFGLFREILLAQYYGTSMNTDAYIIANNIPTILFAALGVSLSTTFIPMYSRVREERGESYANSFTLHLVGVILVICLGLVIVGEVFTKQVVFIFASGFTGTQLSTTISFARILFPSIFGLALMNLMGSYLQLHDNFMPFAIVPMVGNSVIIVALILSDHCGNIYILVWGTLIGLVAQILFYLPWIMKERLFRASVRGIASDRYIRELLPLVIPVFIGEAVHEINSIVDKSLVSGLSAGSVSYLNYSHKIVNLITGVFIASLMIIIYPKLSREYSEKNAEQFHLDCEAAFAIIILLTLPLMILIMVFNEDIVRFLFQRGSFDEISTKMTALALDCYIIGLVGIGIRDLCVKIFCSMQNTKMPMRNGILCALVNIAMDVILIPVIGFQGAALATAISIWISVILFLKKLLEMRIIRFSALAEQVWKCMVGGILMIIALNIWNRVLLTADVPSAMQHYGLCLVGGVAAVALFLFSQFLVGNNIVEKFRELQGESKVDERRE